MKKFLLFALVYIALIPLHAGSPPRVLINMSQDWRFFLGENPDAIKPSFNDSDWKKVQIPHDWAIEQDFSHELPANTGKLPWKGVAWYRKSFEIDSGFKQGDKVYLIFDGILSHPEVYINGQLAGKWDYGYNSFYLDITPYVKIGRKNQASIKVDTRQMESRWYPGAGIYRKVQLLYTSPVHFKIWGNHITTPDITGMYAKIRVVDKLISESAQEEALYTVVHSVISPDGNVILEDSTQLILQTGKRMEKEIEQWFTLPYPRLWSVEEPVLYSLRARVKQNETIIDETITAFGIRYFKFDPLEGFSLNDKKVQLKGVNLHHDHGPLGAKFYTRAMHRQLEIMKEMGCNAIRTSHNAAAPELLSLCDTMGFIVFNEIFDKWDERAGIGPNDDFDDFMQRNIENFMTRDRNHPSVFIWSMGNEMTDVQYNENDGLRKLQKVMNIARSYDLTRPITIANDRTESVSWRHFDYYDLHCWNYGRRYLPAREADPTEPVIISESASTLSTRGFYELPLPTGPTDFSSSFQVSSYDLNAPAWAEIPDYDFYWQDLDRYVSGEFVWTGFDYLGEPTPYNDEAVLKGELTREQTARSSYFGIVDLCGIPKDRFWLYKSQWKPDDALVHILPHWNWENTGFDSIPVYIYTTGSCAELFLNGKSLGTRCKSPLENKDVKKRYRIIWDNVPYEPGELVAIATRDGKTFGKASVHTAGKFEKINLTPDRDFLNADGTDLSYILVEALDENGVVCPLENSRFEVQVTGKGILEGICNGDPQSMEPFTGNSMNLFHGKAMIIVRSIYKDPGEIKVVLKSNKTAPVLISLESGLEAQ